MSHSSHEPHESYLTQRTSHDSSHKLIYTKYIMSNYPHCDSKPSYVLNYSHRLSGLLLVRSEEFEG